MREQIFLSKNFTVIESDIPFTLKFNIKDNTANSAEDVINFKSGWYIFDNNKLLPQYVDGVYNLPKYNCWIEYDETLPANLPHWYTCYINPKSVESLSAEQTELDPAQLAFLRQDIQINGGKVDNFAAATHEDLGAVKTSVDALQSSNHSDLGAVKTSVDALQSSNHSDLGAVKSSVDALQVSNHADLGFLKSSFLFSNAFYFPLIPESSVFPYQHVGFSLPFFDTFISLRYVTISPQSQIKVWHDNWVFLPRGVRFSIDIDFHSLIETPEDNLVFTLIYPVDGQNVSHEYKFTTAIPSYSVNALVPSMYI